MSSCNVRGYLSKSSLGPNCSRFTKIDATTGSPCWWAISISARWPACRLPMVGTNAIRFCPRSWSRRASIEWTTFIVRAGPRVMKSRIVEVPLVAVLRRGKAVVLHGGDVGRHGGPDARLSLHEVAHEPRLAAGVDVEHVVQH